MHMCSRVLPLFGKLPQWNHHANCHVNKTTFQSRLRFQTGLNSLSVSCKRTLSFRNCSKRFYHILKRKFNWKYLNDFFRVLEKKSTRREMRSKSFFTPAMPQKVFKNISGRCFHFIPPENTRKPPNFLCF